MRRNEEGGKRKGKRETDKGGSEGRTEQQEVVIGEEKDRKRRVGSA